MPGRAAAGPVDDASLYALLRARYGLSPSRRQGRIRIAAVGADNAALLLIAPDTAVLEHSNVVTGSDDRLIEYVVSLNHPRPVASTREDALTAMSETPASAALPSPRRKTARGQRLPDGA